MHFSKLASRPLVRITRVVPLSFLQARNFQSPKGYPGGALDGAIGVYKDPNFKLDLKPYEWRDGQWKTYTHLPSIIVWSLAVYAIVFGCIALVQYSRIDHQVSIKRQNLAPFLQIKSGKDWTQTKNRIFGAPGRIGYGIQNQFEIRNIFYHEIEDAIQRRKEQDKLMGN